MAKGDDIEERLIDFSASLMEPLLDECEQLCRIIGKSITTSRGKADD